jgi:hypothetical protein
MAIGVAQLYGWGPSPWFIGVIVGLAIDSIATLVWFKGKH